MVLFTSGSEKAPKAVPLTHRNILTDVQAGASALGFRRDDILLRVSSALSQLLELSGNIDVAADWRRAGDPSRGPHRCRRAGAPHRRLPADAVADHADLFSATFSTRRNRRIWPPCGSSSLARRNARTPFSPGPGRSCRKPSSRRATGSPNARPWSRSAARATCVPGRSANRWTASR